MPSKQFTQITKTVMRLKLNSIRFGLQALTTIGFLGVVLPISFKFGLDFGNLLRQSATISLIIGSVLLLSFMVLLMIEFIQDRYLDRQYDQFRERKVRITDRYFECQFCGNRKVRWADEYCQICEKRLSN